MRENLLGVIDATTKGQLDKLTNHRMPGALPFAGKYRLIDFVLSNMKNANITNVAIFPYGNYRSLQDHVGSGKRWNLDRRRDGLFILPPKHVMLPTEEMITFQRMHEHIEYFRRSTQSHVLLTQANIVWNINFNEALSHHLSSGADITEIMTEKTRLKTFVISRQLLLEYIEHYDAIPYKTIFDVIHHHPSVKLNTLIHQDYTRLINNPATYLRSNLDMLNFDIGRNIFAPKHPIYSKEKTAPPTRYEKHATIRNSMIASGSIIDGQVTNSIIGRDVTIKKGAVVKNSVVMSNAIIENDAHIEYAVLDKGTIVKSGTILEGTLRNPVLTQKEQVMTNQTDVSVLIVASEAHPFIKTGGLADVIGGLSRNLARKGISNALILPLYAAIKKNYESSYKHVLTKQINYGGEIHEIRLYHMLYRQFNTYFIEHFRYFERDNIYGYSDDCDRFAFFNLAVTAVLEDIGPFDVLHIHDWHTALIPLILNNLSKHPVKTLLTLHNIDYQGKCDSTIIKKLGIDDFIFTSDQINCLEIGINTATKLSTVSPTYREELRYDYYGKNLTAPLLKRERDFYGILNGLPNREHPQNDRVIISQYEAQNLTPKTDNKLYLQKTMNLDLGLDYFVIGSVSRIAEQKGFEIMIPALERLMASHQTIQFVLLGTGNKQWIDALKNLENKYPKRIRLNIGYDAAVPNHIYAGADVFIMPSRVEPCGLSQMIAMRYGTLPIVRKTGGLADTVEGFDPITKQGDGFSFYNYDVDSLVSALKTAYELYRTDRSTWKKMMRRAMRKDFSLAKQATKMIELYTLMLEPED